MRNKPVTLTDQTRLIDNIPLVVIVLLIVDSLHFIFARLLLPYLPPGTSAMYVLGVATVEIAIFTMIWGRVRLDVFRRYAWFFLGVGFLVAASTVLNYTSVAFIDPGTASLLGKTSVLFGLGFGIVWLRERLTAFESAGALVAIGGVFVITFQPGDYLRLGSLMVLISTLMYALHAALVKRHGANMSLAEFFLFRLACTTGFLFLFAASRGELVRPSWPAGLILVLAGTMDVAISRGLYYLALRHLKLSHHSLILTLSPVVTIVWTLLLFGVSPTAQQLLGGVAVLAGVLMVTVGKERVMRRNGMVQK
jgi:drug/metabolite transporter (DMT)-like permease